MNLRRDAAILTQIGTLNQVLRCGLHVTYGGYHVNHVKKGICRSPEILYKEVISSKIILQLYT